MTTEGIEAVFLTTHSWGKTAKFFQTLGFELDFETDHNSGQLRGRTGPRVFIAEVPASESPAIQLVFKAEEAVAASLDGSVDVVSPFEDTHYGTREMVVRDPDGRTWTLSAPKRD